jgi:SAM-dependent methyltransferase
VSTGRIALISAGALVAGALWWRKHPSACPYSQRFWVEPPHPFITRARLRDVLDPRPAERLLEVGPGTGYYALPVAEWLGPTGRLDVFDIQQEMLDHTMHRAEAAGLANLVPTQGDARSLPYDDASFDGAYLVAVLGEIADQDVALRELARVIRPGGRLIVGEIFGDPHWVSPSTLRRRGEQAGLSFDGRSGRALGHFTRFTKQPIRNSVRVPLLLVMIVLAAFLAGCGESNEEPQPADSGDPGLVHIHGLGRNPADGSLMVATHTGLFRATAEEKEPVRVADLYQDTMGFTVVGPNHFLGSGHPGTRDDPPFLGLIESRDAGNQWRPISLRGKVDFHILEARGAVVYGFGSDFETRGPRFLRSVDGGESWEQLTPPEPLTGLAIDPGDPRHIVALAEQRGYVSRDGGASWRPIAVPGGLVTWTTELGLVAADFDGVIRRTTDPMGEWEEVGDIGGSTAALEGVNDEVLAATHDARVLSSRDGGRSWDEVMRP